MFDRIAPSQYRLVKVIHLAVGFAVLAAAAGLVFGWLGEPQTIFWGQPLRDWGLGLAFSAVVNMLVVLVRSLLQPGYKPSWWS